MNLENYDYPNSIEKWKNFGPIHSRSVLTINLTESLIQKGELVSTWESNEHSDIIPIEPIVNNPKILSFKFRDGGNSPYIIDFVFEKKKNLITLTKHTFKFDGTENEPVEKMYYGFTRQQLDDPTNELEVENSEYYGVRLLREEFYEKLYKTRKGKRFFIREEVEEVIEFYNTHPSLDFSILWVRSDLITNLNKSYELELDTIPINLISILRNYESVGRIFRMSEGSINVENFNLSQLNNNQKIVLYYDHRYNTIGYYPSVKYFLGSNNLKRNDLFRDLVFDYSLPEKLYKIREGNSFSEHRIKSGIVVDTNFIVRTEEKVIDTIMWKPYYNTSTGFLVVSLKKEDFFVVSDDSYQKKKSKYLNPKYKVFKIYSTRTLPYDHRLRPTFGVEKLDISNRPVYLYNLESGYMGSLPEGIYIRKSKSVWLNDIYVGKYEFNERIDRNELLK